VSDGPVVSTPRASFVAVLTALAALSGCTTTTDSLGHDEAPSDAAVPGGLRPLPRPASYPNPFRDVLGKPQVDIDAKLETAFQQLFHGAADTEAIYFPVDADMALIRDIYHDDERTEGVGLGMLIALELDHRTEFDNLWRYAKSELRVNDANDANEGYYESLCDNVDGISSVACIDPYGMQQFAMALVFAHGRWKSTGSIDYEADALELLDVMLHKEERNGGIVDGVTNVFDSQTKLAFHEPKSSASMFTRPSIVIPAYYALFSQATGEPFWSQAADAGRAYTKLVSNGTTGLMPVRAYLTGTPVVGAGWDAFRHEAYRTEVNLALDGIWLRDDPWIFETSDRLLGFFWDQGIATYGKAFTLDGTVLDPTREIALVFANGAVAATATRSERVNFVQAVWDMETPSGPARYYPGMLDLLALLVLGGRFQIY
jgi:oligosaccharide reducing-end xylanase